MRRTAGLLLLTSLTAPLAWAQSSAGVVHDPRVKCAMDARYCGVSRDPCAVLGCVEGVIQRCEGHLEPDRMADQRARAAELREACPGGPPRHGVYLVDGRVEIVSAPGRKLELTREDLPEGLRDILAVKGSLAECIGQLNVVAEGDPNVLFEGRPLARKGDATLHGGVIVEGSEVVLVNGEPAVFLGHEHVCPMNQVRVPHVGGIILAGAVDLDPSRTSAPARAGDRRLEGTFDGVQVGDGVLIGEDPMDEAIVVEKGSLVLDAPLQHDHPAGTPVRALDADLVRRSRALAAQTPPAPEPLPAPEPEPLPAPDVEPADTDVVPVQAPPVADSLGRDLSVVWAAALGSIAVGLLMMFAGVVGLLARRGRR